MLCRTPCQLAGVAGHGLFSGKSVRPLKLGLPSFPNRLTPGFGAETGWMLNFQDSANAGGNRFDPGQRIEINVYIEQLIDYLKKPTNELIEEIESMPNDVFVRRFGKHTKPIIEIQIYAMRDSLIAGGLAIDAEDAVFFVGQQLAPTTGILKTLKRIGWWLGLEPSYSFEGWDAQCVGLVCGFVDPRGKLHPIKNVAPRIIRRRLF